MCMYVRMDSSLTMRVMRDVEDKYLSVGGNSRRGVERTPNEIRLDQMSMHNGIYEMHEAILGQLQVAVERLILSPPIRCGSAMI